MRTATIDALPLLSEGGISNYTRPLVLEWLRRSSGAWRFELLFRLGFRAARRGLLDAHMPGLKSCGAEVRTSSWPDRLCAALWSRGLGCGAFAAKSAGDVFLATTEIVPACRGPTVAWLLYDLIPLRIPRFFKIDSGSYMRCARARAARSGLVVAISETTRNDAVELLGIRPERVSVVYPGAPTAPGPKALPESPGPRPYILYMGSLALNKNVDGLIRIFARVVREHKADCDLVLTGRDFLGSAFWNGLVRELGVADRVRFKGWVPEQERLRLLSGAHMLWQFSWYEGFGLPVLEAAARGVPVLCSNRGALPEILRNPDQEIDPDDEPAAARKAAQALASHALLHEWQTRGLRRAAEFSWARSVQALEAALRTCSQGLAW